ncbi:hypothetical protein FR483_n096R [Paramecium bursaria Chlorella virus FR483]|uniref:Uncharacterized protein n096R n=1 Tax=Paramecium bursaria Chlorella virus FR483 TaxID=399781 RepID=A7J6F0_PBCVF|nr:hypothetical protein FR483_n096R [Paramecium bursaria Chlorella virus FR483]ABT15381.1 hypothetical protein FR483_n096R [Paramecium bursaria Chlorella virus FR483]
MPLHIYGFWIYTPILLWFTADLSNNLALVVGCEGPAVEVDLCLAETLATNAIGNNHRNTTCCRVSLNSARPVHI